MRKKIRRSIEEMPRPAYIFLKWLLALAALMLFCSCMLFAHGGRELQHLAVLLLESPAGVLLLGLFGFVYLLDHA